MVVEATFVLELEVEYWIVPPELDVPGLVVLVMTTELVLADEEVCADGLVLALEPEAVVLVVLGPVEVAEVSAGELVVELAVVAVPELDSEGVEDTVEVV